MLILTRKAGEAFTVDAGGEQIEITVLAMRGKQARIGITAREEVSILRDDAICKIPKDREVVDLALAD